MRVSGLSEIDPKGVFLFRNSEYRLDDIIGRLLNVKVYEAGASVPDGRKLDVAALWGELRVFTPDVLNLFSNILPALEREGL